MTFGSRRFAILLIFSLLVLFASASFAQSAQARVSHAGAPLERPAPQQESSTNNVIVALAPISRTSPVELVSITLDADISEANGRTVARGYSTFKVHNTDNTAPVTLAVGFPEWAGGALSFNPSQFGDLRVSLDGKNVALNPTPAAVKVGQETRTVNWYAFDLSLNPDEKKVVRLDFAQDLGDGIFPRFTYGLLPSNGWKGPIGSARISIHLPGSTLGEQFVSLDPSLPKFDGQNLMWLWTGFEPDADPGVTFIRLSTWNELLALRAAVGQSPDSAPARLNLARVYQQLASVDTPRRDNFMAQAIAELETAARLDAKNLDAVSLLAEVYENRAGPAGGPRAANYVALALAQWQTLVGEPQDTNARKRAAEDAFYLGLDARSRGENDAALSFFDQAYKTLPQGAGPLYTPEHWKSEVQAAHLALARELAQDNQMVRALTQARAASGDGFDLSPAPPIPSFALAGATVTTTPGRRQLTIRLTAYPEPSDAAQREVAKLAASLQDTRAATASASKSDADYALTIDVTFDDAQDLHNKLAKLAGEFPEREDWNLVRAIVDSPTVELNQEQNTFTRSAHYREEVDLNTAWLPLQAQLNALSRAVGELDAAQKQDDRSQVRLALLRDAQQWWLRAVGSVDVTYELQPAIGAPRRWNVKLGEKETLAQDDESIRPEWYLAGGATAVVLLLLAWGVLLVLRRRRPRARAE